MRSPDLAHATFAEQGGDFIGAEPGAGLYRHSIHRYEALQFLEPGSNNVTGRTLFIEFRELKRGAPGGSHVVTFTQPAPIASALGTSSVRH